ncbi:MAG: pyridoxamine kinase, partial [Clostridia bacterium]|nr:pyridoxamine kinase [Clostridia bacterium]
MNSVPQVAAINDLSGFGRCSLTVSIPILSSMGYQVCPMPTALLSAHTGYEGAQMWDFTANMQAYLAHWEQLG